MHVRYLLVIVRREILLTIKRHQRHTRRSWAYLWAKYRSAGIDVKQMCKEEFFRQKMTRKMVQMCDAVAKWCKCARVVTICVRRCKCAKGCQQCFSDGGGIPMFRWVVPLCDE